MHTPFSLRIFDEDAYFAAGLQRTLKALYQGYPGKPDTPAGLLFFTLNTRQRLPMALFTTSSPVLRLVCITTRQVIPGAHCPGFPAIPVLHRESELTPKRFRQLLKPARSLPVNRPLNALLTVREQEVLGYLMHIRSGETGRMLHISERTVSIFKRKAMMKLGLQNLEGLRQWMVAFGELLPDARVECFSAQYSGGEKVEITHCLY